MRGWFVSSWLFFIAALLVSTSLDSPVRAQVAGPSILLRGDANDDGAVDVSDPITILLALFDGPVDIRCPNAADAAAVYREGTDGTSVVLSTGEVRLRRVDLTVLGRGGQDPFESSFGTNLPTELNFQSQKYDVEIDKHYFGNIGRHYDPGTGRRLGPDQGLTAAWDGSVEHFGNQYQFQGGESGFPRQPNKIALKRDVLAIPYLFFFSLFSLRFSFGVRLAFFCSSLLPLSLLPLSPMSVSPSLKTMVSRSSVRLA